MIDNILFFGRKNCEFTLKLKKFLSNKTKKLDCIISDGKEKFVIKKKKYSYIICFRSKYILKKNFLKKAIIAPINFHPSTPNYRGPGGVNYAIYSNEKYFGSTCHLMNEKIDNGKILNFKKFKILKNDTVDSLLEKTYENMYRQAISTLNFIFKDRNNINILIKKNRYTRWSKKLYKYRDLNNFYKINIHSSKTKLIRKIRATNTKLYKPFISIFDKKFYYLDG